MANKESESASASAADHFVSGVSYVQVSVPASKAEEAVTFYKAAFDAQQVAPLSCCSNRKTTSPALFCAQLNISGTSFLICGDQYSTTTGNVDRAASSGVVVTRLQVDDLSGAVEKASKAGAVLVGDCCVQDPCCGGKMARLLDPFGFSWDIVASASAPQAAACCAGA